MTQYILLHSGSGSSDDGRSRCGFFVFDFHLGAGVVGAGEEADHVGVLFDGTGLTKIGEDGALAFAGFER
jgi:hypothetical protein